MDRELLIARKDILSREQKLRNLVDSFLAGRSDKTNESYYQDLKHFAQHLGMRSVDEAARVFVSQSHGCANSVGLAYKAALIEGRFSPSTINRRLAALRSIVLFANTIGLVGWKLEVKNVRHEKYRDTTGITISLFQEVIDAAASQKNEAKAARDIAVLRVLIDLGLRRAEVISIDYPRDLDFTTGTLWILGKGEQEKRRLSLPEVTQQALKNWLTERGDWNGPLITNFDRSSKGSDRITDRGFTYLIEYLGKKIGVKLHPHKLRHTAITEACKLAQKSDIALEEVLDFSRHKDIRTLLIYRDRERNVQGMLSQMVADQVVTPETR